MQKSKEPEKYIREVTEWASSCNAILALALVGSHARNKARSDSDIDFVLICEDMSHLLDNLAWIEQFGKVKSHMLEDWGVVTSVRVVYINGQEVEFGIAPRSWADIPIDEGTYGVVADGMMILDDKRGILKKLRDAITNMKTV
jgi:predicted nucleotidyltransferase